MMVGNPLLAPVLLNLYKLHPGTQNSVMAAVDISAFTDLEEYKVNADLLAKGIKSLPRLDGVDEILLPGEIEDRVYAQRERDGVPLPQGTVDNLRAAAAKLGVEVPAELR
jgi:ureidoglycolate dehydrogenase (NAD+)